MAQKKAEMKNLHLNFLTILKKKNDKKKIIITAKNIKTKKFKKTVSHREIQKINYDKKNSIKKDQGDNENNLD